MLELTHVNPNWFGALSVALVRRPASRSAGTARIRGSSEATPALASRHRRPRVAARGPLRPRAARPAPAFPRAGGRGVGARRRRGRTAAPPPRPRHPRGRRLPPLRRRSRPHLTSSARSRPQASEARDRARLVDRVGARARTRRKGLRSRAIERAREKPLRTRSEHLEAASTRARLRRRVSVLPDGQLAIAIRAIASSRFVGARDDRSSYSLPQCQQCQSSRRRPARRRAADVPSADSSGQDASARHGASAGQKLTPLSCSCGPRV